MLSLCMIVRNEQDALPACLASVADVADEMIVVDTGSTDGTREIAEAYGAIVLDFDFTDVDFAAARNFGLARARGNFALVLDADETLDPHSLLPVRRYAAGRRDTGYVIKRRNQGPDGFSTDHAVRLFPVRADFRYRYRVHETVDASILGAGGRLQKSEIVLHHGVADSAYQIEKSRFYLGLLLEDLKSDPADVDRLTFLAAEYHRQGDFTAATGVAERLAALLPDDFGAQFTAALYHHAYGDDPVRARRSARNALRLSPGDAEAQALYDAYASTAA